MVAMALVVAEVVNALSLHPRFQNSDFLARNCSDQKLQFSVSASMSYFGECLGLIHT